MSARRHAAKPCVNYLGLMLENLGDAAATLHASQITLHIRLVKVLPAGNPVWSV